MPGDFPLLNPAFVVVVALWFAAWWRHRRFSALDAAALGLSALAVYSVRFTPLAVMAFAPRGALALSQLAEPLRSSWERIRPSLREVAGCGVLVAILAGTYITKLPTHHYGAGVAYWRLPVDAAEWIKQHPPPGRGWNSFNTGGVLTEALGPKRLIAIDGRNDTVYSDALFARFLTTAREQPAFDRFVAEHDVRWALVECRKLYCDSMPWVCASPQWQLVFADDTSQLYIRAIPETAAYRNRFGFRALRLVDASSRLRNPATPAAERAQLERESLELLARAPGSLRALLLATLAMKVAGRHAEYERFKGVFQRSAQARNVTLRAP
jgi:hypothetical protein